MSAIRRFHCIQVTCPSFSKILINTYLSPSRLTILGGAEIQSTEDTTQVDNLAMSFHVLATVEIQNRLWITASEVKQVWSADDAKGAGSLESLKKWWINIIAEDASYGYCVNESKSWLILKNQTLLKKSESLFSDTKINVTTEGKRHLGAVIGSNDFRTKYVNEKVTEWCSELKILSEFAKSQPQAAYAAFYFGEQNKFSYFLRTIPEMNDLMKPVDEIVQNFLLPAIIGETISEKERELYSLPVRLGGLGIPVFSEKTCNELENLLTITIPLVALIITQGTSLQMQPK